jgi:hypothetical protein
VGEQVQHKSAATTAHLTDRLEPLPTSTRCAKTFSDHAATSYGLDGFPEIFAASSRKEPA